MKLIGSFLSVCLTFLFLQCKNTQFVTNPKFKITNATYHSWTGGQPGVGGINVKVELENASKINFDSIYFRGRKVKAEVNSTQNKTSLLGYFSKKNKNISDLVLDKNPTKELKNTLPTKETPFPFELDKNEAVISYNNKEITKYLKITVVKKETKQFQ